MSLELVEDYSMNAPKPQIIQENPIIIEENEESDDNTTELKLDLIEKQDIFIKPKQKIIDVPKQKEKRSMSDKQKLHLQNLISRNKQRALDKKQKLQEKIKKKEDKARERLEKKRLQNENNKIKIPVKQKVIKTTENNFVNDLRNVDKRESKTSYYNDMEKMFGLFTKFQQNQSARNEDIINRRVQAELNKKQSNNRYIEPKQQQQQQQQQKQEQDKSKPQSYKIDFSQYSFGGSSNNDNQYGY